MYASDSEILVLHPEGSSSMSLQRRHSSRVPSPRWPQLAAEIEHFIDAVQSSFE